jgi:ATP-dependent Zn protease
LEETAYHEAGHAVAAVYLGGTVRSLTIDPDRDDGPARFGDAQIEWHRRSLTAKEFQHKLVLVALAGPVAEMIYTGDPLHPGFVAEWADDWHNAWQAAEPIMPDERLRLAFLEEAAKQLHELLQQDDRWAAIAALADELVAHETLEAEQIHEVVAFWLRRSG